MPKNRMKFKSIKHPGTTAKGGICRCRSLDGVLAVYFVGKLKKNVTSPGSVNEKQKVAQTEARGQSDGKSSEDALKEDLFSCGVQI